MNNKKILVAEDNNFVRMQITTFLKGAGYDVIEAVNGDEALSNLSKELSLAIVDVRMEPMNGFDFIKMMQGEGFEIPVILVTGDQNHDLLSKAGQYKVNAVLLKPVQKERLIGTVERILKTRTAS